MMPDFALTQERAAALENELSEFSYIVSHDLAAVCRHLTHFSQLLVRDAGDGLTGSQKSVADHIRAAGEKCQTMMEQLLIFSRTQQRELKRASLDARHLVEIAVLQLSGEVHAASAEVSIGPLGTVFGDGDLLTAAFKRMLDNAIKFRRHDGPCRIQVSATQAQGCWVGRVVDNGIGLAPEQHEKAFRMFWQLCPERSESGVGAGLAICRRIARRHGGEVRFIDWREGACVEFALPLADNAQ